jgi:hypothetical protein
MTEKGKALAGVKYEIDDTATREHEAEVAKARAWQDQHLAWKNGSTKTLAAANLQIERMGAVITALLKERFNIS